MHWLQCRQPSIFFILAWPSGLSCAADGERRRAESRVHAAAAEAAKRQAELEAAKGRLEALGFTGGESAQELEGECARTRAEIQRREAAAKRARAYAALFQYPRAKPLVFHHYPQQQMLRADIAVAQTARCRSGVLYGQLRPLRELLVAFQNVTPLRRTNGT